MENNINAEHRRRVKEKFLADGISENAPAHEILEFLLFYAIPRKDTKVIAKRLLEKFGTLSNVLNASHKELINVDGMGEHSAILIKLIPEIAKAYNDDILSQSSVLNTVEEVGTYLLSRYAYFGREEIFSVVSFNSAGKLLSFNIIEKGDLNSVGVSTRKVIETLLNTNASSVIIAHNHPDGSRMPSAQDLEITKTLYNSLKSINVDLLDHIIIAGNDFISLRQNENFKNLFID